MKKVRSMKIDGPMSVNALVSEYKKAGVLAAGEVARAVDIYEKMIKDNATVFLGLSGALIPGGLRTVVRDLINDGYLDVLVITGANLVHDLIEAFGNKHYIGSCRADDVELKKQGINRIYNIFLPDNHYDNFDIHIKKIYGDIAGGGQILSIREFLHEIGKRVKDEKSILRTAYKNDLSVFCPAISDSELGLTACDYPDLHVDAFKDVPEFIEIAKNAEKSGVIILGGGVPKNFIFQAMVPEEMKKERGGHEYVIQITLDRPETGGLSGATLDEAISWGKVKVGNMVTVVGEVSTIFPIIVAALRERLSR